MALEPEFWSALQRLAAARGQTLSALVMGVDGDRTPDRPLASALRVTALLAAAGTGMAVDRTAAGTADDEGDLPPG